MPLYEGNQPPDFLLNPESALDMFGHQASYVFAARFVQVGLH